MFIFIFGCFQKRLQVNTEIWYEIGFLIFREKGKYILAATCFTCTLNWMYFFIFTKLVNNYFHIKSNYWNRHCSYMYVAIKQKQDPIKINILLLYAFSWKIAFPISCNNVLIGIFINEEFIILRHLPSVWLV